MNRKWLGAPLVIAAAALLGIVALGGAWASSDRKQGKARTIVLEARGDQFTTQDTLDLGEDGLSQGDRFVFNDDLFRHGKPFGSDAGECTVVRKGTAPGAATYQCVYALALPGGQITAQGLFTEDEVGGFKREVFAITGGTGRYRAVRGDILDERLSPTSYRYTLRLIGPTG